MARTTRELRQRRHARIRRRLSGTAERPRVAVSRTNKHISAQIIDDAAGRTLASASSVEPTLKAATGGNVDGAKAVAALLAQRGHGLGPVDVAAGSGLEGRLHRRGGRQRATGGVVDDLGRNVLVGTAHGDARTFGRAREATADPRVATLA